MKTFIKLLIAFMAGLFLASSMQASNGASKTYDAVKLAEYSACLADANNLGYLFGQGLLNYCSVYKPK